MRSIAEQQEVPEPEQETATDTQPDSPDYEEQDADYGSFYGQEDEDDADYDLSSEEYREYIYPDGHVFTIHNPLQAEVLEDGGHLVAAANGNGYYVAPGFVAIHWQYYGEETV
jgi:hypothetical protein